MLDLSFLVSWVYIFYVSSQRFFLLLTSSPLTSLLAAGRMLQCLFCSVPYCFPNAFPPSPCCFTALGGFCCSCCFLLLLLLLCVLFFSWRSNQQLEVQIFDSESQIVTSSNYWFNEGNKLQHFL